MSCVMSYLLCERWAKGSNIYGSVLTLGRIRHVCVQTHKRVCLHARVLDTHVTCSQSFTVQGKYLSVKYFVQLSVCMAVCITVPFCL